MNIRRIAVIICTLWLPAIPPVNALPLWEIEGTDNRIRLMGSIHFLRAADYPLPAPMIDAYESADVVIMELDMSQLDLLEAATIMQRMAVDPNGKSLVDHLGASNYRKARSKAALIDVELSTMQAYEPWFAALQITQLRVQQLGFDASYGIETRLTQKTLQDGKPTRGLETMEAQLSALDSLPASAQKAFLMQTLDDAVELTDELDSIFSAWKTGDTDALERELLAGLEKQPELYERILVQRNADWTRQIANLINDANDYLIVVGTLHLVGDDSVLKMLEELGHPSRQIR